MDTNQIAALAREILDQYNLPFWKVRISNHAKRRAGACHYGPREISLSIPILTNAPESEVRETILHEVAHALKPGHGHDHQWKQQLIEMGGTGARTHKMETVKGRYDMVCTKCGVVGNRHQKTGNWKISKPEFSVYSHRGCGGALWLRDTKAPQPRELPEPIRFQMPAAKPARVPVAAAEPAPKTGPACQCQCGGTTKGGSYLPGHDARHVSTLAGEVRAGRITRDGALEILAARPALQAKLLKATTW